MLNANRDLLSLRIPVLFASSAVSIGLCALYLSELVMPGPAGAGIWVALGIVFFAILKVNKVPVLSLSCISVIFYVYVAVMFVWPVIYPQVFISTYSRGFQTESIFAKANHLTAIGMSAFLAGWLSGFPWRSAGRSQTNAIILVSARAFPFLILLSLPLTILALPVETIFTTAYSGKAGNGIAGVALAEINVIRPALFICLVLSLASMVGRPTLFKKVALSTLFVIGLAFGFMGGTRLEQAGCLLGAGYVIQTQTKNQRIPKKWLVIGVVLIVSMLVLGEIRSVLSTNGLSVPLIVDATGRAFQVTATPDTLQMRASNNGDIAVTLCAVIGLIETGALHIDYGETFWNYIRMTLPRFANPNRPVELQVLLQNGGRTGGGLFILSEPLLAGGSVGVLIVLALSGSVIGHLEGRALSGRDLGWQGVVYLLLLCCTPTWFLYSILSMYKYMLTGLLIALFGKLAAYLLLRNDDFGYSGERQYVRNIGY